MPTPLEPKNRWGDGDRGGGGGVGLGAAGVAAKAEAVGKLGFGTSPGRFPRAGFASGVEVAEGRGLGFEEECVPSGCFPETDPDTALCAGVVLSVPDRRGLLLAINEDDGDAVLGDGFEDEGWKWSVRLLTLQGVSLSSSRMS